MAPPADGVRPDEKLKVFSLADVQPHNTPDSCWIVVRNKVYDVTSFVPKHPGGTFLFLGAGKESTHLFDSYHPTHVEKMLNNYLIGDLKLAPGEEDTAVPTTKSQFYPVLKKRVEEYFKENHLNPKFAWSMVMKTVVILASVGVFYAAAYYAFPSSMLSAVFFGALLGLAWGNVGTNVMHDGNHGSYTRNGIFTRLMGVTIDFVMGASSYVWLYQHLVGHHVHTNIIGLDPDIRTHDPDLRRLYPQQKWFPRYVFQHLYAGLLYGLLAFKWFVQDIQDVMAGHVFINKMQHFTPVEAFIFAGGKIWFLTYTVVIPLAYGVPITRILAILVAAGLAESYWLAFFFQVNHVTDKAFFITKDQMKDWDWAELQTAGTTNFCSGSVFWNSISGGLSHQIEHHLFPGICHMYYPAISVIVQATCKEFNVPYSDYPTFLSAITGHINHLKNMGTEQGKELLKKNA